MKIILLSLASLLLISCSMRQVTTSLVAGAIGIGIWKTIDDDKKKQVSTDIIEVDTSGTMLQLGGALISPTEILHVTHWPVVRNQVVKFKGRDGKLTQRRIISKYDLGEDLALLTLNEPLDILNHQVYPIGEAVDGAPVTIYRLTKEPFGTTINGGTSSELILKARSKDGSIVNGDSGKGWFQLIDDKVHIVGFNSRGLNGGTSPNVYSIYHLQKNSK